MRSVKVPLGDRSYEITIGKGVLGQLPKRIEKLVPSKKIIVLTNKTVHKLYFKRVNALLKRFGAEWIVIPDGEKHKNLETVEKIYGRMVQAGMNRKSAVVALGGGVIGDMAGFAAATYMRGIPFIQIPTTLLAQVDSSVGGKTGVDLPSGKNLVGAFHQPLWVGIDTDFLKTLPRREYRCGLSEVVKYGVLWDERFFGYIEKNVGKILALNHNALEEIIGRSCAIKAKIVSQDEKENGVRALLNLGHTVGHAVEALSGFNRILHGEAVSMGMAYSALLSLTRRWCKVQDAARVHALLTVLGLPVRLPAYPRGAYERAIQSDKKSMGAKIRYIAIERIGKAVAIPLTPGEITECLPKNKKRA